MPSFVNSHDMMFGTSSSRINGLSIDRGLFAIVDGDSTNFTDIVNVLNGKQVGVIYRNFLSQATCDKICENFWKNPNRYSRGADAPAQYVGTYHYRKPLKQYAQESREAKAILPQLFSGVVDPVKMIVDRLQIALHPSKRQLRAARCEGEDACAFVMRSWSGSKTFALEPHDDEAQCRDPLQSGFEVQAAVRQNAIGAVNLCLQNGEGGLLRLWNIRPDQQTKIGLGVEVTGSPYHPELLAPFDYIDMPIKAGDLYVFDGRFVHAVTVLKGHEQSARATLAFLLANLGDHETLMWT